MALPSGNAARGADGLLFRGPAVALLVAVLLGEARFLQGRAAADAALSELAGTGAAAIWRQRVAQLARVDTAVAALLGVGGGLAEGSGGAGRGAGRGGHGASSRVGGRGGARVGG